METTTQKKKNFKKWVNVRSYLERWVNVVCFYIPSLLDCIKKIVLNSFVSSGCLTSRCVWKCFCGCGRWWQWRAHALADKQWSYWSSEEGAPWYQARPAEISARQKSAAVCTVSVHTECTMILLASVEIFFGERSVSLYKQDMAQTSKSDEKLAPDNRQWCRYWRKREHYTRNKRGICISFLSVF